MQKKYRTYLFAAVSILVIIGIIMVASSSYIWAEYKYQDSLKYFKNQLVFGIMGFVFIYVFSRLKSDFFYNKANLILGICLLLLCLVLIPGLGVIRNGSRSWFSVGPFGFQPSEIAKIALILFTSKYLSNNKIEKKFKNLLIPTFFLGLVFFLIMLQPDFGTGIIIVISIVAILFVSNLNKKFFYFAFIFGVFAVAALIVVAPYRMARIISFINPWSDPLGSGFQIIQSLYAIGPGGLLGVGLFNSRQKFFYLPEPQTDFIFSIICEELGIIGALIIAALFLIIMYASVKLALSESNLFKKYTIFGLAFSIVFQAILNLSVVVGLIPVTGVTLPFLSYGGSSLLVSMASIGIILNISKNYNN